MNEKENDKKDGANETYKPSKPNEPSKPLEPHTFLPKKGNYQDLASYKKATVIYDLTFYFAKQFLSKGDRTIDQMVQAARSGKQNIAEGCAAAATSAETELKLVNVARASMKELLVDYEDYLRVRGLEKWSFDDERTRKTREFCKMHEASEDFMRDIDRRSDEAIANITITLLHQFDNIIGAYIAHLEKTFVEKGGIREQMTAARLGYRNSQKTRIAELEAENARLKARIAVLEAQQKGGEQ
jgi:four helix bundle suffix protein